MRPPILAARIALTLSSACTKDTPGPTTTPASSDGPSESPAAPEPGPTGLVDEETFKASMS